MMKVKVKKMTVKEYYDKLQPTQQNLLQLINTYIVSGRWNVDSAYQAILTGLSMEMYVFNFEKELNPIVEIWYEYNNTTIEGCSTTLYQQFIRFLFGKYKDKWIKLWDNIFLQEYNPIWNYDGTNSVIRTFEHGKQVQETRNMTDTYNKGTTETTTITSDITENSRRGFNSASDVNTDKSSRTGSSNVAGSGYDSNVATGTDTFTNSGCDTERITETKGGNQGTTTTQRMLTEELEFRIIFNYFDIVCKDIISELALNIYI